MAKHISIRMAWHDNGWNGAICKNPKANTYCIGRFSYPGDAISINRNVDWEQSVCGKACSKLDEIPPCSCSINAFGCDPIRTFQKPPKWWKDGAIGIHINLLPATVCIWPYDEVYGDDVELGHGSNQKYDNNKRFEKVKGYFSDLEERKSLLFYYANYSNPLSEEDSSRYVLIGIARLKEKGKYHFFENVSENYKQRYANGLVWQYPLTSNYPDEGVRIPYHLYMDNPDVLKNIAIYPDNTENFKYATRPLSDDDALSIIEKFIYVMNYLKEIGDKSENWDERLKWLNSLTTELWKARGPYPGLIKVLNYLEFTEAMEYLRKNPDKQKDLLSNLNNFFNDKSSSIKDIVLEEKRITALKRKFKLLDDDAQNMLLSVFPLFDISETQIKNIIDENRANFGIASTLKAILENPYILSEQYAGTDYNDFISFNKIDNGILPSPDIGINNFFEKDAPERFRALCVDTLRNITEHSFLSGTVVISNINHKLKNYPDSKSVKFNSKYFEVDKTFLSEALTIKNQNSNNYIYLKETWEDERIIEKTIKDISCMPDIIFKTPIIKKYFEEILFDSDSELAKKNESEYKDAISKQSKVCFDLFNKPLCVISGAAGTGKTTIVSALLSAIEKIHGAGTSFLLLAPTGKASQRIREKTGKQSMTIHSLLASKGWLNDNFTYKRKGGIKSKEYSTVIIDECSMIDLGLLAALFRCLDWDHVERFILIGDPNQLPPIGRGKVFSDIIGYINDSMSSCLGKLEINLRQMDNTVNNNGTSILELAETYIQEKQDDIDCKIKKEIILKKAQEGGKIDKDLTIYYWKNMDELEKLLSKTFESDLSKYTKETGDNIQQLWQNFCRSQNKDGFLNASIFQILSPYRGENYGVDYLNTYFQSMVNKSNFERYNLDGITLGDKVIQIRNRPKSNKISAYNFETKGNKEEIYNGEIGFTYKHKFESKGIFGGLKKFNVRFDSRPGIIYNYGYHKYDDGKVAFSEPVEENLELAYVLSIHKAQGSEFNNIYLILPNKESRLLSMELLYTGITRASKHLTIFAQDDISSFTKLCAVEKSNMRRINSSIFKFNPLPDDIIYPIGKWYEDNRKISTLSEYYVRSKSEMNIANIMAMNEIPFEYETPLFAPDGTMYLPDFTISWRGKKYFWEHVGRLDLEGYKKHWEEKESWYKTHFPEQLIITYESENQSKHIEKIINDYFK